MFSKRVAKDTCSFLSKVRNTDLKYSWHQVSKDKLKSEADEHVVMLENFLICLGKLSKGILVYYFSDKYPIFVYKIS